MPYEVKDVGQDKEALQYLVENGYQSVPVTRIGEQHVVGFNPAELQKLLA